MSRFSETMFGETEETRTGFELRDYQLEDVDAVIGAFDAGKRGVIARAATGLGKSVMIAELAHRLSDLPGRVMVTVDVGSLAVDLANTIAMHTGKPCGLLTGETKRDLDAKVIVSTIQTLYAKDGAGEKRYVRDINPNDFGFLLIDECESALADEFGAVVQHFLQNPSLRFCGATATPFRGDGRGMGRLFDHAANDPGPLNRDILWGRDNGWLVNVKQAFVRVSVDFSTLKLRKDGEGVRDYKDEDLAQLLCEEQAMVELAKGIHHVSQGQPSIVICPNVQTAKLVAHYLDAEQSGSAYAVYGELGDTGRMLIDRFKKRDFPFLTSVNMLYKGFDADIVRYVFMARKTRSRRLYEQAMGRGTRPLKEIREALAQAADAAARLAIIAESAKPHMTMVDLVGVDKSAKDLGVIDILADRLTEEVRERAKRKMVNRPEEEQDAELFGRDAEKELEEEKRRQEERERRKRKMVQVDATVHVETTDDLSRSAGATFSLSRLPERTLTTLQRNKVPEKVIEKLSESQAKKLAGIIIARHKQGLCTYGQAALLRDRLKYPQEMVRGLTKEQASRLIEACKGNSWRPVPAANVLQEVAS